MKKLIYRFCSFAMILSVVIALVACPKEQKTTKSTKGRKPVK